MNKVEDSTGGNDVEAAGLVGTAEETSSAGKLITGLLMGLSVILIIVTLPFSLCVCFKMVQEYERAVIFRLGRIKKGGAVGPGLFFIIPCTDQVIVTSVFEILEKLQVLRRRFPKKISFPKQILQK